MLSQHPSYNFDMVLNKDNATCGMYALVVAAVGSPVANGRISLAMAIGFLEGGPEMGYHQFVCASHPLLDSC
jgi:hypothetical protein